MKILIDDANPERIGALLETYPIDGVTTNPTILSRCGGAPYETLRAIRALLGDRALHVQVAARDRVGMIADAERILSELGGDTYIKIPCVPEGYAAMSALAARGVRVTGTAVCSPMQALMAANCGAKFVAPYVNRMDTMGCDGVEAVRTMQRIFDSQHAETGILGASFRNTQQVLALAACGVAAVTVSPDVLAGFDALPAVTAAVDAFTRDFEALCGPGKTMRDC